MDFGAIVSVRQATDWYSPACERCTTPIADLAMLAEASRLGDLSLVSSAWLGACVDVKHQLVLGFPQADGETKWHMGIHHWPKSACMLWPVQRRTLANEVYFEMDLTATEPTIMPIFDLSPAKLVAGVFEWKSWLWQCNLMSSSSTADLSPGIRPFLVGHVGPWVELACRQAFWNLPRSTIYDYARHFKIEAPSGASLFELLWCFIDQVLHLSEEATLEIVHRRVASQQQSDASQALLQVDEALEVLEHMDIEVVHQEQERLQRVANENADFAVCYRVKARAVQEKKEASAKRQRKESGLKQITLPHHIEQKDAKKFIPQGGVCSVWRAHTRGEWHGHYKGLPRISESFQKHGSSELAFKALLQRLWGFHLSKNGLDKDRCPIVGLFD